MKDLYSSIMPVRSYANDLLALSPAWALRGAFPQPPSPPQKEPGANFNFAFYDCLAVGGGEYKLVPRRPRKMVPISFASKAKGISVQTIHNYIVADFLKTVERPTPFKWLIDLGELDALLTQTTDMEFWTPERTAAYLKAKRGEKKEKKKPSASLKKPKPFLKRKKNR